MIPEEANKLPLIRERGQQRSEFWNFDVVTRMKT